LLVRLFSLQLNLRPWCDEWGRARRTLSPLRLTLFLSRWCWELEAEEVFDDEVSSPTSVSSAILK
jgi:hypothetical protein